MSDVVGTGTEFQLSEIGWRPCDYSYRKDLNSKVRIRKSESRWNWAFTVSAQKGWDYRL